MTPKRWFAPSKLASPPPQPAMKPTTPSLTPTGDVPSQTRSAVLKDASAAVGTSWALECVNALRASGRLIEGGWPGTLPEARARILSKLSPELSAHGLLPLDAREVGLVASSTNAEARRSWHLATKRRPSQAG
jgi:hypothetical protein